MAQTTEPQSLELPQLKTLIGKQIGVTLQMAGLRTQYKGRLEAVETPASGKPYLMLTDTLRRVDSFPFTRIGGKAGDAKATLPWSQVVYAAEL